MQIDMLKAQVQKERENDLMRKTDEQYGTLTERSHYAAGMWTGVAIAGVGLAMTAVGAYLVVDNDKPIEYDKGKTEEGDHDYRVGSLWGVGWTMLGAGVAAAVAGSIVTGIMGYYYTHTQVAESPVAFHLSPMSADLTIQF